MLTRLLRETVGRERGQMLIMGVMLLVLLLGFAAIVVDVGFFLQRRERIQHITDAAALAGAQELPEDRFVAEDIAREWADRNGLDGSTIAVSFECRAQDASNCEPSSVDTILVEGEMKAPLTLMPVLRLIGASGDSCWLNDGCTVTGAAAACRGECTSAVTPMDIVLIMDRTGSMSDGDMDNAKEGARAMLEVLNPELQSVALGVLPPSRGLSYPEACQVDRDEPWSPDDPWVVVDLSDDYKRPDGGLDATSRLVGVLDCLQSADWTNIGYPVQAARQHLDPARGFAREGAGRAIVLLSDGAANQPVGGDPCALAAQEAENAKSMGIEVYTIGYGTNDNTDPGFTCSKDTGPWRNQTAETLLRTMATDDAHFFQEPQGADLTGVFEQIGLRLATGSRLVE